MTWSGLSSVTAMGETEGVNAFCIAFCNALKANLVKTMTSLAVNSATVKVKNKTPATPTAFEDARSSLALIFLRIDLDVDFLSMVKFATVSCKTSSSNAASLGTV